MASVANSIVGQFSFAGLCDYEVLTNRQGGPITYLTPSLTVGLLHRARGCQALDYLFAKNTRFVLYRGLIES